MRTLRTLGVAVVVATGSVVGLVVAGGGGAGGDAAARASAPPPKATGLEAQFVAVVKKVAPAVVQIEAANSLGSGVVFDARGDVVTNYHVVGTSTSVRVTLANGKGYAGRVLASFPPDDLAVVRIGASGLHPIEFARSSSLEVGDIVLAVGNPLGLRSSVTDGIVSALGRTVSEPTGAAIPSAIQTSAPINPGNSGGALVDLSGRLVGIPTLAASDPQLGGQAAGIGFAIPSDTVRDIATQIVQHGKVVDSHRAYLGIRVGDTLGGGVYVGQVTPGGPAAKAGIRAGDIVTAVADKPTPTSGDLSTVLAGLKPGQSVKVALQRANGSKATVKVTLGSFPGS